MKNRCLLPSSPDFVSYGGRGISVDEEWMDSSSFIDWSLKNGYADHLVLDRRNNEGNYGPGNCRWV